MTFFLGVLLASGVIWGCFADLIFTPDLLLFLQPNGAEKVQLTAGAGSRGQLKQFAFLANSICKQRCHLSQTSTLMQAKRERARTKNQNKISCRLSMLLMTNFRGRKFPINMQWKIKLNWGGVDFKEKTNRCETQTTLNCMCVCVS